MRVGPEDIQRRPPLLSSDVSNVIKNIVIGISICSLPTCLVIEIIKSILND